MHRPARTLAAALTLLAVITITAACARRDPTTNPEPAPASDAPLPAVVTFTRTGGFAGVRQTITIQPEGTWVYSGRGRSDQGTLRADETAQLRDLIMKPSFMAELRQGKSDSQCSDAFEYSVTVGSESSSFEDCNVERPTVKQSLALLSAATPF